MGVVYDKFNTKIRYSDGKEETITTPVPYSVGDVITVVKKRDGSVVVALAGSDS